MNAGEAIYRDQCSACHGLDGKGVAMLFPSLAQSSLAHASDPASAIRLVLRGGRSVATDSRTDRARHAVVRLAAQRRAGRRGPDLYPQCLENVGRAGQRGRCRKGARTAQHPVGLDSDDFALWI